MLVGAVCRLWQQRFSHIRLIENVVEILTDPSDSSYPSLARRVRAGISWNASAILISQTIGFVRSIIIARLLVPEDFGLFSMALTVTAGLNALTATGMEQSVLSNSFADETELKLQLNTAWSAELLRSVVLTLIVIGSAYPMSLFYQQPKLRSIISVLSLMVLIQSFQNIGLVMLRKQISFARIFWYELAANAAGVAITIALAVILRSVWALVYGMLLSAAFATVLSYMFHSYRPRLAFDQNALRRALSFAKFAFVIAIASYITTMADNVMVGRLLGTSALGEYALAYNLASLPVGVLIYALGRVLFPAYAEIGANDPQRLRQAFIKVFTISSVVLMTIAVPVFLLSGEIIQLVFGSRWSGAAPALRVLALLIPLRGLVLVATTVFYGLNRPRDVASGKVLEAAVFLILLYPLVIRFGLTGAAWAGVIAYGFALVNRLHALRSIIPNIARELLRTSLSTLAAAAAGLLIAGISLWFIASPLPRLIVAGSLATLVPALLLVLIRSDLRGWLVDWSW